LATFYYSLLSFSFTSYSIPNRIKNTLNGTMLVCSLSPKYWSGLTVMFAAIVNLKFVFVSFFVFFVFFLSSFFFRFLF
jgi:hypothetical protein